MKKFVLATALLLSVTNCYNDFEFPAGPEAPVRVIFDTDMGDDCDDVGALIMLHAMVDKGEAKILATVTSNIKSTAIPVITIINAYYNRPEIPVGATIPYTDYYTHTHTPILQTDYVEPEIPWHDELIRRFPDLISSAVNPDAVSVYRRVLASEADTSATIILVGGFTNLALLLESPPDEFSPLNGCELVRKKVKRLVAMSGHFPQGREVNIYSEIEATHRIVADWPTPVIFCGWELGNQILTGKELITSVIPDTPAKVAYSLCMWQGYYDDGRPSFDQIAVMAAIRGIEPYFSSVKGRISVAADGSNSWINNPFGLHEYLKFEMKTERIETFIESLMMHTSGN